MTRYQTANVGYIAKETKRSNIIQKNAAIYHRINKRQDTCGWAWRSTGNCAKI